MFGSIGVQLTAATAVTQIELYSSSSLAAKTEKAQLMPLQMLAKHFTVYRLLCNIPK